MICYIVLHYKVLEETKTCVSSIRNQTSGDSKIIIIDNYSNDGSGETLRDIYQGQSDVEVLISQENLGFARGNNLGYRYAREQYQPDFMVVMNNDIEIVSQNLAQELEDLYQKRPFHVLGPDIYSTSNQLRQNPKRLSPYTYEEVETLHQTFSKAKEDSLSLRVKCWLKSHVLLRKLVYQRRNKQKKIDFDRNYEDVILHGSCLIVSRDFIEQEETLFHAGTFFYYEMEILDFEMRQKGYRSIYSPRIKVLHHQNVSTNLVYDSLLSKTLFANRCNYESTGVFLSVMESYGKGG